MMLTTFDYVEAGENSMECTPAAFIDEALSDQLLALIQPNLTLFVTTYAELFYNLP